MAEHVVCAYCAEPIVELRSAFLLLRPSGLPVWRLAHGECADEHDPDGFLYSIELARIVRRDHEGEGYATESLEGWRAHMHNKTWFTVEHDAALDMAHRIAVALKGSRS